ncbi:uncharacterized protein LOC130494281 isoform X2 [Raphanus sativus]|uniref:Uncharacterized protein LOC130494281 isoform X2 n=1 Tax=Raphanus sativus TaxID=3726 RepID=A0A6J0P8Q8_RAPSA|nr:uncharacterized protein LOC130494281 isoform X2 [Raphanus sativus]
MEPSFPSYFFHKLYFREQVESILVNMKEKSDLERDFFWSDMLVCRRWTLMILVDRKNDSQNVSKLHMKHARKFVANVCPVYSVVFHCSRLIFIQCWIVFAASTSTTVDFQYSKDLETVYCSHQEPEFTQPVQAIPFHMLTKYCAFKQKKVDYKMDGDFEFILL